MPTDKANLRYRFAFVLVLTLVVLGVFFAVIRTFVLDLLLAALFAGTLDAFQRRALRWFDGNSMVAAAVVVTVTLLAFALPLLALVSLAGAQAVQISEATMHWVQYIVDHPTRVAQLVPDRLVPDAVVRASIQSFASGAGGAVRALSGFMTKSISTLTQGALSFFLHLFVMFYAMFYFLRRGPELVDLVLSHIPVAKDEGHAVIEKILLVTKAILKSVLFIGLVQATLIGISFAVVGIQQPLFWAAITFLASAVPSLGPKLVWIPAVVYLLITDEIAFAIGLAVWGLVVIELVDNVLRPYIVGRDTALPDFLVLVSTLGGLVVFGVPGIVVGPVLAAVLLGVLELYQNVMRSTGLSNDAE